LYAVEILCRASGEGHVQGPDVWIERLECRVRRWSRARKLGRVWVVAVSGGGDSVALLRLLHSFAGRLRLRLSAAHLDHGARGDEARQDSAFVAELCDSLGLHADFGQWRPARAAHFESDARRARYAWLTEIAHTRKASVVAVAHTSDDQAETILHRIVRGTGLRGLAGMAWIRALGSEHNIALARPLLDVPRRALRDYLSELGQPFQEDRSNTDVTRTRARIRHDLLPKLQREYNPKAAEALVRLGAHAAALCRSMDADLEGLERAAVAARERDAVVLKRGILTGVPALLRAELLRRIWRGAGWPEQGMMAQRWWRLAALVVDERISRTAIGSGVAVSSKNDLVELRRHIP
jgi:tRNA(Ile)-lysidine synthase